MGAVSRVLLWFVPRWTTTYQAVLGADDTLLITVVLVALPELSAVSGCSPMTLWVDCCWHVPWLTNAGTVALASMPCMVKTTVSCV